MSKNSNFFNASSLDPQEIKELKVSIKSLSYQECIDQLEELLQKLQSEDLQIEQLQAYYMKGSILLEKCENLLNKVENEVTYISQDDSN